MFINMVYCIHEQGFIKEIEEIDGCPAWIIADVIEGSKTARIVEEPTVILV